MTKMSVKIAAVVGALALLVGCGSREGPTAAPPKASTPSVTQTEKTPPPQLDATTVSPGDWVEWTGKITGPLTALSDVMDTLQTAASNGDVAGMHEGALQLRDVADQIRACLPSPDPELTGYLTSVVASYKKAAAHMLVDDWPAATVDVNAATASLELATARLEELTG